MAAGGMAADDQRPSEFCEFARCRPHLFDDVGDGNGGAKIVARHRDVDAMGIQPAGEMTEERAIERLPVAAVNEDDDGARAIAGKQIDPVTFARTIRHRFQRASMRFAIGLRIARPAGDDRRVFRHPRAVVVFDLVVHIRVQRSTLTATPSVLSQIFAPSLWSWRAGASVRGHPSAVKFPKVSNNLNWKFL